MKDEAKPLNAAEGFERFKELTRRIVAVPKKELEEQERKWKKRKMRTNAKT
jgi:hypothetical protein